MPQTSQPNATLRRKIAVSNLALLVLLCGVQLIDAFDVASMAPALPKIGGDLHMSPSTLQWVVTAYVLGYGGFLLLGGRLADIFDRKRILLAGLAVFFAASVVGGVADSSGVLIGARLVKGISAGFTAPAALAILLHLYSDEGERNKALGAFITVSSVGFTSGLVLGGLMADVSWRIVLLVPAGFALLLLAAGGALIPRPADHVPTRDRVDVIGAIAATAGLLVLVYGVSRASTHGWGNGLTIAALAAGVALLVAFVLIERVRKSPLVPLSIFRRPGIARGNATIFFLQGGYVGWQFIATLYLQNVDHWSPVGAGLVFAPGGFVVLLTAQIWARYIAKHGPGLIAFVGVALMIAGSAWSLELGHLNSALVFLVATSVMGIGYAMTIIAANITAVAGARPTEQGVASGLFLAALQVGAGVVLGVVASVFNTNLASGAHAYRAGVLASILAMVVAGLVCLTALRPVLTARFAAPSRG